MKTVIMTVAFLLFGAWAAPVRAADTLCPDIAQEKDATPDDVAGVQADIERLNLCVERAKLLRQLDQIAKDRAEMLGKASGDAAADAGNTIPPLPASALPSLPTGQNVTPLVGDVQLTGNVKARLPAANPLDAAHDAAATTSAHWRVRKIWGQGAGMRAQITDGSVLLNVVKGDPLPDGHVVETVSVRGVAISQNGKVHDLSWDDTAPVGSTLNAAQAAP